MNYVCRILTRKFSFDYVNLCSDSWASFLLLSFFLSCRCISDHFSCCCRSDDWPVQSSLPVDATFSLQSSLLLSSCSSLLSSNSSTPSLLPILRPLSQQRLIVEPTAGESPLASEQPDQSSVLRGAGSVLSFGLRVLLGDAPSRPKKISCCVFGPKTPGHLAIITESLKSGYDDGERGPGGDILLGK